MKNLPIIAFWALGLIWGSNFIYMKMAAVYISPMQVVFLEFYLDLFQYCYMLFIQKV